MNELELKREKIEKIAKIAGLAIAGLLFAPIALLTIKGLVSLIFVAGLAAATVNIGIPWFAMKMANWRLQAIKFEAAQNPVETLQNQSVKKHEALNDFAKNLEAVGGQILSFSDEVKKYVKDGMEDAQTYVENLAKMKEAYQLQQQNFLTAKQSLAEFDETIRKTDRKWKMACAAAKMNEAVGQLTGDVFDQICIETAVGAVQDKLNQAFAALDIENLKNGGRVGANPASKSLTNPSVNTASAVQPKQRIAV